MRRHPATLAAALAALTLAACASPGPRDTEKYALYDAHAGAPADHFRYFGQINGWTPLGDSALAVWTRPSEAWLLDLSGPCQNLAFTPAIGLTSTMSRVDARFDKVLVRDRGTISLPCHIRQIRPLDVKAVRAAEKQNREGEPSLDRPSDAPPAAAQPSDSGT
ncbi:DUF6491 family protein [Luteimonas sp. FCS-9]|uniref:DUF6491 family protein n=1 Tax=Luteimonas sp. FCS-9 TaxID=1547516 RepID=UPI00063EB036|nr:DUF6491 family protein [Luteimonas sp. FCS-9]KLJ01117.1 hypothetical protein WQ56_07835 [Luteimonas sp. FCS-9]